MKKFTLIAFPVQDITVARYLAARGIDVLGVDLDRHSTAEIETLVAQLRSWTSGPDIIGFSRDPEKLEFFKSMGQWFDGFYLNDPEELGESGIDKLDLNLLAAQLHHGASYIFDPGQEQETGVFDFEKLDEVLDEIERMQDAQD